jgi:hypothetical protein
MARRAVRPRAPLLLLLALSGGACGRSDPTFSEVPLPPTDTTTPPVDTVTPPPTDTTTPPPPDTLTPPPPPPPPGSPPTHNGILFGPADPPQARYADYSGAIYTATSPDTLLMTLETARRANTRLFVSFSGNEQYNRDQNGFSVTKWKQRIDRFRGVDLSSYINDGTLFGHFIMDEPSDPTNWNGTPVKQSDIEEIARYSKEVWPNLVTMIRAWPDYLKGYEYPHLDATRIQYLKRFGPVQDFLSTNLQTTKGLGLALVGGLNVLNGGTGSSGIPGRRPGLWAMSADELRSWGGTLLSEPYLCAFILFEYEPQYFSRPDIKAALDDLSKKARSYPTKSCAR